MSIEKRLESMANLQGDFVDKLENIILKKWEMKAKFLVAQSRAVLKSMPTMSPYNGSAFREAIEPITKRLKYRWQKWRGKSGEDKQKARTLKAIKLLKTRRLTNSVSISLKARQGRVRVEKSDNDLIVRFDGFHLSRPALIGVILCCGMLLVIPIFFIIWGFFFSPIPITGVLDAGLWQMLCLLGFMISLVLFLVKAAASLTGSLNGFVGDCIRETVNLFEAKEQMQRQPPEPKTKGALDIYLQ